MLLHITKKSVRLFPLLLIIFMIACSPTGAAQIEEGTDAYVDEIDVLIMESFPVQVSALVHGNLADGCVVLDGISAERNNNTFTLTIETHREGDMCTEALVPFERTVALDVDGLEDGTYQVVIGDVSAEFTLANNGDPESSTPAIESEIVLTLERTACFGTCPIYTITIYDDGRVVYDGTEFVTVQGVQETMIDPAAVLELVDFMLATGYNDFDDAYTNRSITDMPSTITSLTVNGETKRIDHYYGDDSAPITLLQIENRIDMLANSAQWTGQEPDNTHSVFGQLILRGAASEVMLPTGSTITVRLEDVSLMDAPSIIVAERVISDATMLPTDYYVSFDLMAVDGNAVYEVSAEITDADGNLRYISDTAHPVLTFGHGRSADIELISFE